MFQITQRTHNRLDIIISGKLDSDSMKAMIDELIVKSRLIEHGLMLYRLDKFTMPTLKAIAVELSRLFDLLRMIKKFDRAAVISDVAWVRYISQIEGAFIPGLMVKAFHQREEKEAELWLTNP